MPRSGARARRELQAAAIELFRERGFDAVTTAEIAERAGVTERTYFRHFPDKREVLFDGENALAADLSRVLADAPAAERPLATLVRAFHATVPLIEGNRPVTEPLAVVVAANPALRERQAGKGARMVELLVEGLVAHGVGESEARLASQVGWGAMAEAVRRWMTKPGDGLAAEIDRTFAELRTVVDALD